MIDRIFEFAIVQAFEDGVDEKGDRRSNPKVETDRSDRLSLNSSLAG
jgi:hypothetical protein